jgi:hypothetical protein
MHRKLLNLVQVSNLSHISPLNIQRSLRLEFFSFLPYKVNYTLTFGLMYIPKYAKHFDWTWNCPDA